MFEIIDSKVGTPYIAKLASSDEAFKRELLNLQRFQGMSMCVMSDLIILKIFHLHKWV